MTNKEPMKVVFAPGCFDGFEGTQEELDSLVTEIQRMIDSGEFEENMIAVDEADVPPEVLEQIAAHVAEYETAEEAQAACEQARKKRLN